VLEAAWTGSFCVPNHTVYPWLWLWDSCFHAVTWAALGDDRAVRELAAALEPIDPAGFVPHMRYVGAPDTATAFWGRPATSSITQPPMFGHAVAALAARGFDVEPLVAPAAAGLRFLLDRPRIDGLVALAHPWETGCDDSPRWDHWCPGGFDPTQWRERKGALLATVERGAHGSPLANPAFRCGSAAFTALVAWNATELAAATGDDELADRAAALAAALAARWDGRTFVDSGDGEASSGRVVTLEAALGALVVPQPTVVDQLDDPAVFGAPFGPTQVARADDRYDPTTYWRGGAWPQLSYLAWLLATRSGASSVAAGVRRSMWSAVAANGFAEYWDAATGEGFGAVPQTWATLPLATD
jgi:hypothetical protein